MIFAEVVFLLRKVSLGHYNRFQRTKLRRFTSTGIKNIEYLRSSKIMKNRGFLRFSDEMPQIDK